MRRGVYHLRPSRLTDGKYPVLPAFPVPLAIPRPPSQFYQDSQRPFGEVKTKADILKMRTACQIAASALLVAARKAIEGVTTEEVDRAVSAYLVSRGAYPSGIGFMGFPKSLCSSVNEVIAHGIPDMRPLENGDIVNFDITCWKDGFYGDCSLMVEIGEVDSKASRLIKATKEAMDTAIDACRAGARLSVVADRVEAIAKRDGLSVVDYFAGHFIGREMHLLPNVSHSDPSRSSDGFVLKEGHVFTVEPILTEGATFSKQWQDSWTHVTMDGGWAAQWEHTILVTGPNTPAERLTLPDDHSAGRNLVP
jgi:methionyl aminopeptidase